MRFLPLFLLACGAAPTAATNLPLVPQSTLGTWTGKLKEADVKLELGETRFTLDLDKQHYEGTYALEDTLDLHIDRFSIGTTESSANLCIASYCAPHEAQLEYSGDLTLDLAPLIPGQPVAIVSLTR